ncbi:MAG: hypothetical protein R3E96_02350 [Planctomycetota bacterium]
MTLPADLPEDAVFLVEDKVITRAEIERWVAGYRTVEPGKSEHALRRFVVTNQNLPVVVAGLIDPLGREAALEQMQEARRRVLAGEAMQADGPEVRTVSGPWKSRAWTAGAGPGDAPRRMVRDLRNRWRLPHGAPGAHPDPLDG